MHVKDIVTLEGGGVDYMCTFQFQDSPTNEEEKEEKKAGRCTAM